MAVTAIYVDYNSFTVVGDQSSHFDPGRAILAYHSNSGAKLVYVDYSTYDASAGITTVNTLQTESENLASDLISIDYSCIKPNTMGIGNIPTEALWLYRGLRKYMHHWYYGTTSINIMNGIFHIHDGVKDRLLILPGSILLNVSTSPYGWCFIYVGVPSNGLILTSSDFTFSKTVPTLNYTKCGYYDSTGTKRCLGFFWVNEGGAIYWYYSNNSMHWTYMNNHVEPTIGTGWTLQNIDLPLGNLCVHFMTSFGDTNTATITGQIKEVEDPDEGTIVHNKITTYSERMHGAITLFVNASKNIYLKNSASQWVKINTSAIHLPYGLSGQC